MISLLDCISQTKPMEEIAPGTSSGGKNEKEVNGVEKNEKEEETVSQVTPVMQQQNSDAALLLSLSPPMKPFSVITPTLKPLDVVGGRNRSLSLDILCDAAESALSYGSLMQQQKQLPVVGTTRSLTLKRERYSLFCFTL